MKQKILTLFMLVLVSLPLSAEDTYKDDYGAWVISGVDKEFRFSTSEDAEAYVYSHTVVDVMTIIANEGNTSNVKKIEIESVNTVQDNRDSNSFNFKKEIRSISVHFVDKEGELIQVDSKIDGRQLVDALKVFWQLKVDNRLAVSKAFVVNIFSCHVPLLLNGIMPRMGWFLTHRNSQ